MQTRVKHTGLHALHTLHYATTLYRPVWNTRVCMRCSHFIVGLGYADPCKTHGSACVVHIALCDEAIQTSVEYTGLHALLTIHRVTRLCRPV